MNDIVDRIARGEATLLGIDDICDRLGISRTTFDRWVRNGASGNSLSMAVNASSMGINALVKAAGGNALSRAASTGGNALTRTAGGVGGGVGGNALSMAAGGMRGQDARENSMTFPPADIRIGNSPKWEMSTFKKWLLQNAKPAG